MTQEYKDCVIKMHLLSDQLMALGSMLEEINNQEKINEQRAKWREGATEYQRTEKEWEQYQASHAESTTGYTHWYGRQNKQQHSSSYKQSYASAPKESFDAKAYAQYQKPEEKELIAMQSKCRSGKNYHEIFDAKSNASVAEIKRAYRKLLLKFHPDRFTYDKKLMNVASDVTQQLNTAYKTLTS